MGYKSTKTISGGTKGMYMLDTRGEYIRPTNLPPTWTKVRIGLIGSLTGSASEDNVSPVAESMAVADFHRNLLFGLSDGVGFPGDAGAGKFIGLYLSTYFAPNLCVGYNGGYWNISKDGTAATGLRPTGIWTNGATSGSQQAVGDRFGSYMTDPAASSNYAFAMVVELDCTVDAKVNASCKFTENTLPDDTTLTARMNDSLNTCGIPYADGWWSSTVPTNVTQFLFRWPLSLNRFRILNTQFANLS